MSTLPQHYVQIKPEFLLARAPKNDVKEEGELNQLEASRANADAPPESDEAVNIDQNATVPTHSATTATKEQLKPKRKRGDIKTDPSSRLCPAVARGETCPLETCTYLHDIAAYLSSKPSDLGDRCYNFDTYGYCSCGFTCRFGNAHIDRTRLVNIRRSDEEGGVTQKLQINSLRMEVQQSLRKKAFRPPDKPLYDFSPFPEPAKRLDFENKVYVAPLTTVGNLPFRRILRDFGADVTCGEMAVASNLEQGQPSEWALLRRHPSEEIFGVQIAGGHGDQMRRVARVLEHETLTDFVDINSGTLFSTNNNYVASLCLGCPIDLICNRGCGSALLNKPGRLLHRCVYPLIPRHHRQTTRYCRANDLGIISSSDSEDPHGLGR